jgi:hypothetical protein
MVRLESIGETGEGGQFSVCEIVGQSLQVSLSLIGEMGVAMSGTASCDMNDALRNGVVRRKTFLTLPPLAFSHEGRVGSMSSVGLMGTRQLVGGALMLLESGVVDCQPRRKAGCIFSSDTIS